MDKKSFIPVSNFPFPKVFVDFVIRPSGTFSFISSSPTFFLSSLFCSASKKKKKTGQAYQGEMDGKTSGKGNRNPVCTHTWACVPPISQWLNLKGREGEDVLSKKHWIGLMPGSVVLFGLIKGETQRWG